MKPRRFGWRVVLSLGLVLAGAGLLGRDAYLQLKGVVATELVAAALVAHLRDGRDHRPWRWADFQPVARLEVPRLGVRLPVLAGAVGQTMAFGLAHVGGTAQPGQDDNVVLVGHRDSWARFMADVQDGDLLVLDFAGGRRWYRVRDTAVVDHKASAVMARTGTAQLTLVTCYPLGGLLPTSQRFVIEAEPVADWRHAG